MSPRFIIIHYKAGVVDKLKPEVLSYWVKRDLGSLSIKSEQELQVRRDEATPNIVHVDLDIDEDSDSRRELNSLIYANKADEIFRLSQHKIRRIAEGSQSTTCTADLSIPNKFQDLDFASNASDPDSNVLSLPRGIKRKSEDQDGDPNGSKQLLSDHRQNINTNGSAQTRRSLSESDEDSSECLRRDLKAAESRAALAEAAQRVLEQQLVSAREGAAAEAKAHKRTCNEAKRILEIILAKVKRLEEGRLHLEDQLQSCITSLQGELRRERRSRMEVESTSKGRISELEARLKEESMLRKQAETNVEKTLSSLRDREKKADEIEDILACQKEELCETRKQYVKSQTDAAQKHLDLERKLQLEEGAHTFFESQLQEAMKTVERLMTERFTAASPMPAPNEFTYESVGLQTEELSEGVQSDLAEERQRRLAAERLVVDINKERHDPFVVPALLDIFLELSRCQRVPSA